MTRLTALTGGANTGSVDNRCKYLAFDNPELMGRCCSEKQKEPGYYRVYCCDGDSKHCTIYQNRERTLRAMKELPHGGQRL